MRKIQFASGTNLLEGWENYDRDMDITKPLPIPDCSVEAVFCEAALDHITTQQAWQFMDECYRILVHGGVIRLTIQDFVKCWLEKKPAWLMANQHFTGNNGTLKEQFKAMVFGHEHKAIYCADLVKSELEAIGFERVKVQNILASDYPALTNVERHHKTVGFAASDAESSCIEGVKP